jgi:hypothetical protein
MVEYLENHSKLVRLRGGKSKEKRLNKQVQEGGCVNLGTEMKYQNNGLDKTLEIDLNLLMQIWKFQIYSSI